MAEVGWLAGELVLSEAIGPEQLRFLLELQVHELIYAVYLVAGLDLADQP